MMAAGLRATAKAVEHPPAPNVGRASPRPNRSVRYRELMRWIHAVNRITTNAFCGVWGGRRR
jgi:hypothetical protein